MRIWEENVHKCNENSVAMQKHLLKTGKIPYRWDLTAFVWKSILLCFLQDTAVSALLQRTSPMISSVWTTAGVWRESASHSVKLWRTCSRVLAMVSWPADNAHCCYMAVTVFRVCLEQTLTFLLFLYLIFQRRTAPVRYAVGIRTQYVLLMSVTRATTFICGKANPALWAFVMERWEPTYSYSYEKNIYKSCFYSQINCSIHKTIRNGLHLII